jgi:hypothetical protein
VAAEDHLDEGSLGYHDSVSGGMGEKDEGEHASPQKTTRRRSASASDGRAPGVNWLLILDRTYLLTGI